MDHATTVSSLVFQIPRWLAYFREIHVDVALRWTVEHLARTAGMSRAAKPE
jgi:hypothetical protein